ncbi:MAG: DUF3619 family protein [Proteobacteria bacterium]|nr:DUF3619 family protein [Pseudomonadota bacterium]MBU1688176.1 DUF3619 family protein [Pseudomonadota bacterium]
MNDQNQQENAPPEPKGKELDQETLARIAAFSSATAPTRRSNFVEFWHLIRVPAAALMALFFCLLFGLIFYQGSTRLRQEAPVVEDIELLSDPMEPEFYQSLDFYRWLNQEHRSQQLNQPGPEDNQPQSDSPQPELSKKPMVAADPATLLPTASTEEGTSR